MASEYRVLSVTYSKNVRSKVNNIEVEDRTEVTAVINALAREGWEVHRFDVEGSFAFIVFRR